MVRNLLGSPQGSSTRAVRVAAGVLLVTAVACHGRFSDRTSERDKELNNFAEARQRAAIYYDGKDYIRAALQYREALKYRPKHVPTRLGYGYSLMYSSQPTNLREALKVFTELGEQSDKTEEVKRVYGLGLTHLGLARIFDRRARTREDKGRKDLAEEDRKQARKFAQHALTACEEVLAIDAALADRKILAPQRISASLAPDAHIGMAWAEIMMATPTSLGHLKSAEQHLAEFAKTAENARKFWESRRQRTLVTDPLHDDGTPGTSRLDPESKIRYEARIASTIMQEADARKALMLTFLYLNQYRRAIDEATRILDLDPDQEEVYAYRGNAYAFLKPPNYRAAVQDLKRYRKSQDLSRLTDDLVQLNRRIKMFEQRLKDQEARRG